MTKETGFGHVLPGGGLLKDGGGSVGKVGQGSAYRRVGRKDLLSRCWPGQEEHQQEWRRQTPKVLR